MPDVIEKTVFACSEFSGKTEMHIYETSLWVSAGGKATACDVFHVFCGKRVQIGTSRHYRTYPAAVRARAEGEAIAKRHAACLNLKSENIRFKRY